jgi:hypothetical protein
MHSYREPDRTGFEEIERYRWRGVLGPQCTPVLELTITCVELPSIWTLSKLEDSQRFCQKDSVRYHIQEALLHLSVLSLSFVERLLGIA